MPGIGHMSNGTNPPIRPRTLLAYALPALPTAFLVAPMAIVQGVYAKYFALSLTAIAGAVLFVRMFDAVIDPLIGYFSDRHRAKIGSRKPFMIAGGLTFLVGGYLVYSPPADVGVIYFCCTAMILYTGWSLLEVPHITWAGEICSNSIEKTKAYSYRTSLGYGGLMLFYVLPMLPFFPTTEVTPETLRWTAIVAIALMLPFLYISMTRVPDGHVPRDTSPPSSAGFRSNFIFWLRLFGGNRPFLIPIAGYLAGGIGAGIWYGIIFTYVDAYLGLGTQFAGMFMLSFAVGMLCTPLWYRLSGWLGVKGAWIAAMCLLIISYILTGLLRPGETSFGELLAVKVLNTLGYVALNILTPSIISQAVDYGTWKFGVNRGGSYFAAYIFSVKAVAAIGAAIGLAIAGWHGFDATSLNQTDKAMFGMNLSAVWLPIGFSIVCILFVFAIPMNARRHGIIKRRLDAREARQKREEKTITDQPAPIGLTPAPGMSY